MENDDFDDVLNAEPVPEALASAATQAASENLAALNALSDAEQVAVVDAAMGRTPQLPEGGGSSELGDLLAVVKQVGLDAFAPRPVAPAPAERQAVDWSRFSDSEIDRATDAILAGQPLPDTDGELAVVVREQIQARQSYEDSLS
jgi:hypothetical protein